MSEGQLGQRGPVEGRRQSASQDSSIMGAITSKVCCVCGADVAGRTRFKDGQGRYWCPGCNEKDQLSKEPATCPDCAAELTKAELLEFKGVLVCRDCHEKRQQTARRDEARIQRVEQEAREDAQRRRQMMKIGGLIGIVLLILIAFFVALHLVTR